MSNRKAQMKTSNALLPPGATVRGYTITRKLSAGGFGVVYLAQRPDGQSVAIKEFLPSVISCRTPGDKGIVQVKNTSLKKRFEEGLVSFFREADILAQIHNDRIIQIWDVFEANGTAYFVMPVEIGGTLQARIRSQAEPLDESKLVHFFSEAALGIQTLHDAGLLHLDIKPSNLWVRPDDAVVVLDLGASRWEDEEGRMAHLARTPGFAAPEQHGTKRARALSVKTDIYGLGASLYTAIERRPPPPAPSRRPEDLSLLKRRMGQHSTALLEIVDRAISLLPGDRFNSAAEFSHHLLQIARPPTFRRPPRDHLHDPRQLWKTIDPEQLTPPVEKAS